MHLPIDQVLPSLSASLTERNNVVLVAEPGAGKTTKVPLSLLDAPWLRGRKIILLEPRRLAARSAVSFMASTLGERPGDTIGFRVRGEARVSSATKLEVVTEGILTRIIQNQPELDEIGLIIFDEFHERSLHADLGLALSLEVQRLVREDLRILVMSATLDAEGVSSLMNGAPVINCPGRTFPVEARYLSEAPTQRLDHLVADAIRRALRENEGDLLVFLPGRAEIAWVAERLEETPTHVPTEVFQLHSDIPADLQDRALRPASSGKRKVILATSIAETSLTISGVRVVIDSGLMRIPKFDPRRSMSGLETVPVSQAAAEQRMGRAGREAPGVCYRLWTAARQRELQRFHEPEIMQADLASLSLELSLWGDGDPAHFSFLTPPPAGVYAQGRELLRSLRAIDGDGRITDHGRAISRLGVHPRIGHMLLRAREMGVAGLGCDVAALLEERSVFSDRDAEIDLSSRWHALDDFRRGDRIGSASRGVLRRLDKEAERLRRLIGAEKDHGTGEDGMLGALTALAYPDRIGQRRQDKGRRYLLRNGAGAELPDRSQLNRSRYLAIAQLDGSGDNARVFLAEPLDERLLRNLFGTEIVRSTETYWSASEDAVRARERDVLGALVLTERPISPTREAETSAMLEGIRLIGIAALPWTREAASLRARSEWTRRMGLAGSDWPDLSDGHLAETLDDWLAPHLAGITSKGALERIDLEAVISGLFTWPQRKKLDELAPSHLELPTGTRAPLDYSADSPIVSVLLQEMLGQRETPKVGGGKVPITIELLSPARRPLQVTQDLESFWKNSYAEVRKEMLGRYPKHVWPTDPMNAEPTRRAKPRPKS